MQDTAFVRKNGISRLERTLFYFTLIDILFFPYFFLFATSYSQLLIFIWFLLKPKREFDRNEYLAFQIIGAFVLLGTCISFFTLPDSYYLWGITENIKRAGQFVLSIIYYFFFYYIFKCYSFNLKKYLFIFLSYVTLWGLLYLLNFGLFLQLKNIFNHADSFLALYEEGGYLYRYNFIWSDPNNVGYMMVAVVIFLLINCSIDYIKGWVSISMLFFTLLLIMSSGAWLSVVFFFSIAFLIWFFRFFQSFSILKKIGIILGTIVLVFFLTHKFLAFQESEVGQIAMERLASNSGDSRFVHWRNTLSDKPLPLYLFAGEGYQTFVERIPYSSHSGHLLLIYGYGAIAYILFMYITFRKRKNIRFQNYIYIFPLFLCFSVNIGIGELKFIALLFLLVAYSSRFNTSHTSILLKK